MVTDAGENSVFLQIAEKSIIYLALYPKEKKKEKVPDKMFLGSVLPGWPYCVTYPSLLNHVLCILHQHIHFHLVPPPHSLWVASLLVIFLHSRAQKCSAHRASHITNGTSATLENWRNFWG